MRKIIPLIAAVGLLMIPATTHAATSTSTSTLTVVGGSLSLSGAAVGNFSATLGGSDQKVDTSLGSYTASDSTGTGNGWNITFQATQFTCTTPTTGNICPTTADTLPLSSLMMPAPTVACATGTACSGGSAAPSIKIATATALDTGTAVKVASAAVGAGMGTYNFTPGTIGSGNLELAVPSSAYATTYTSTVTISQISGP